MDAPETIETERLVLRRARPEDAEAVFAYASDPEVTRYMDWPTHVSVDTGRRFIEECAARWASGEEFTWLVTVRPDDRALGAIAIRIRGEEADFGYVLHRSAHGRGYATEAARAVVEWALGLPSLRRITATCDVENAASARVLSKAGLSREAVLPAYAARPNLGSGSRDALLYGLDRRRP